MLAKVLLWGVAAAIVLTIAGCAVYALGTSSSGVDDFVTTTG